MSEDRKKVYQFGPFRVDEAEHCLLRDGEPVPLTPKAFETLLMLVQNAGRTVAKEELLKALWPDSFVEENNLAVNVSAVRKALDEGKGKQRYVETVPKRGYRFIARVEESRVGGVMTAPPRTVAGIAPFQAMKIRRLTSMGKSIASAISPDGKYVVHVVEEGVRQSLWVKQVSAAGGIRIVPPDAVRYKGGTFSPGSDYLYYAVRKKGVNRADLYQVPMLGGAPRKVMDDVDSPITFSPDGQRIAFLRGDPSRKQSHIMIAKADGTDEKKLATRTSPDEFEFSAGPVWSPDGSVIATPVGHLITSGVCVSEVRVVDGTERLISKRKWQKVGRMAWLGDGSGLVLSARDKSSGISQVWHVSYPDGEARRVTNDLSDYGSVTLTADGSALAAVQSDHLSSIWVVQTDHAGSAEQVTPGKYDGRYGLCWTPDRKIVYASGASGIQDIWTVNPDGTGQKQLTAGPSRDFHPDVTADGRSIIFISNRTGSQCVWRMDIDGNSPQRLTDGVGDAFPQCSPDGKWVVYQSHISGKQNIWRVPVGGGSPVQMTGEFTAWPAVSPDGTRVACEHCDETTWQYSFALLPFEGGSPSKVFDLSPTLAVSLDQTDVISSVIRWTPDGRSLAYLDSGDGVPNVWSRSLEGAPPIKVTDFISDHIFWFDWAPGGTHLACARGVETSDVVLISDFKQS
jgi:eukaryotic-like serine/threonine-protein kinase